MVAPSTSKEDPFWIGNRIGMESAGLRYRLGYWWLQPSRPTADQVAQLLAIMGPLHPGEGIMLDVEQDGVSEPMVVDWCSRVEAATHRPVAVYCGKFVAGGTIWNSPRVYQGGRPRVLPWYQHAGESGDAFMARVRAGAAPYGWDVLQFHGGELGRCPGVAGPCDEDQVDGWEKFNAACGYA